MNDESSVFADIELYVEDKEDDWMPMAIVRQLGLYVAYDHSKYGTNATTYKGVAKTKRNELWHWNWRYAQLKVKPKDFCVASEVESAKFIEDVKWYL